MATSAMFKSQLWIFAAMLVLISTIALANPANDAKSITSKDKTVDTSEQEDPSTVFARAEQAMNRGDLIEALSLLSKLATRNYLPAQAYLAEYLDYSEYNDEAVGWFMTAAYQGNVDGAFGLGKMYAAGEGIAQSNEKAIFWFRFAAERNHLSATRMMYSIYKEGLFGQPIDKKEAKYWEEKLPALEAHFKKTYEKKKKEAEELAAKTKREREEYQEILNKKILETKALEKAAAEKISEEKKLNESKQGASQ